MKRKVFNENILLFKSNNDIDACVTFLKSVIKQPEETCKKFINSVWKADTKNPYTYLTYDSKGMLRKALIPKDKPNV